MTCVPLLLSVDVQKSPLFRCSTAHRSCSTGTSRRCVSVKAQRPVASVTQEGAVPAEGRRAVLRGSALALVGLAWGGGNALALVPPAIDLATKPTKEVRSVHGKTRQYV